MKGIGNNRWGLAICRQCFFLRASGYLLELAFPSMPQLFSERFGYRKPIVSFLGFRIFAGERIN